MRHFTGPTGYSNAAGDVATALLSRLAKKVARCSNTSSAFASGLYDYLFVTSDTSLNTSTQVLRKAELPCNERIFFSLRIFQYNNINIDTLLLKF